MFAVLLTFIFCGKIASSNDYSAGSSVAYFIDQDTTVTQNDTVSDTEEDNTGFIETNIDYQAADSIVMSRRDNKVYLYGDAKVVYGNIELTADYIEYSQDSNLVFARGVEDSTGQLVGKPIFKEGGETYDARIIRYNFKSRKGYIKGVETQEQEGILHGSTAKKHANNHFHFKNGRYTTCDKNHPHFYIALTKGKIIPNERIIAGPSYLVMEDIPLPLGIPFGFFPIQQKQTSGFQNISVNEESRKGFSLQSDFYLGINDHMDLTLTGEIYSLGSYGLQLQYRLTERYKYTSRLNANYQREVFGDEGTPEYRSNKSFRVSWSHSQAAKANPYGSFNANVNYSTSGYDRRHGQTVQQRASNNKTSSISYRYNWPNSPFDFNGNLRLNQNTRNREVSFTLPSMSLNMSRQYPLRGIDNNGRIDWYENLQVGYSADLENRLTTKESLLFKETTYEDFESGFQHRIPVSLNFKVLNHFNLTPNLSYKGVLYPRYVERDFQERYDPALDSTYGQLVKDTIHEFKYAHSAEPSISFSTSPKVYGMFQFKDPESKVQAIRHVMTPSASISFRPSLGNMTAPYYDNYTDERGNVREYSYFDGQLYSPPSSPRRSGNISLGLSNNLEMKVRSEADTTEELKKVKLLDNLSFNTSYNIFADSLNWSTVRFNGRTNLFDNNLNLNLSGTFDPYAVDNTGNTIDKAEFKESGKLARLTNFRVSMSTSLSGGEGQDGGSGSSQGQASPQQREEEMRQQQPRESEQTSRQEPQQPSSSYDYFQFPWSLNLDYSLNYSQNFNVNKQEFEPKIRQTIGINGNFSLTPKWDFSFSTNYDIREGKIGSSQVSINRDLHCFSMSFTWVPVGYRRMYNFSISVNSSMLQDALKFRKDRTFYDNF
ncbi:MAG: LPS-assembly protein LptD [Bacteroidales bacterium]|nr:LPS-assembly protein LptD [Bacteroidales bacterium]